MNELNRLLADFRDNLSSILPLLLIALLSIAAATFTALTILPEARAHARLIAAAETSRDMLADRVADQKAAPDVLQARLNSSEDRLGETAGLFLTDEQASQTLNNLYRYADASGVTIISLQAIEAGEAVAQPADEDGEAGQGARPNFDVHSFQVQASGEPRRLIDFVAQIREAAVESVVVDNLSVAQGEGGLGALTAQIHLYTSPYAGGTGFAEAVAALPDSAEAVAGLAVLSIPTPTPTPTQAPVCDCSANLYDCEDFAGQEQAQACYDACGGAAGDVHLLDDDLNGLACETYVWP